MMAYYRGYPIRIDAQKWSAGGANAAASIGTAVTSHASANTKGSSVALTGSYGDYGYLTITSDEDGVDFLIDVEDSSGNVWVGNILFSMATSSLNRMAMTFPIFMSNMVTATPYVKCQSSGSSKVVYATWTAVPVNNVASYNFCDTIGATAADSGGKSVDPGGSAHTKGSWVEFAATASNSYKAIVVCFGGQINTSRTTCSWLVDVGVGGAGTEVVVIPNIPVYSDGTSCVVSPSSTILMPCNILAGERITVRAQCSITDATDRLFDAVIYGYY